MYSYSIQMGCTPPKYFTGNELLGKEGQIVRHEGVRFFILVVDGHHVECIGNDHPFPANQAEHEQMKTEYFSQADYFRDDD
jgi:hypothetical protein